MCHSSPHPPSCALLRKLSVQFTVSSLTDHSFLPYPCYVQTSKTRISSPVFLYFVFYLIFVKSEPLFSQPYLGIPGNAATHLRGQTEKPTQRGDIQGHLRLFSLCLRLREMGSILAASAVCGKQPWAAGPVTQGHLWRSRPPQWVPGSRDAGKGTKIAAERLASFKAGS